MNEATLAPGDLPLGGVGGVFFNTLFYGDKIHIP